MGLFSRISERMERQSKLMGAMMERYDVDMTEAAMEASGTRFGSAARTCMVCGESDACQRWMESGSKGEPGFCPNIRFFEQHRR